MKIKLFFYFYLKLLFYSVQSTEYNNNSVIVLNQEKQDDFPIIGLNIDNLSKNKQNLKTSCLDDIEKKLQEKRKEIEHLKVISATWSPLTCIKGVLKKGAIDPLVSPIKERLSTLGFLKSTVVHSDSLNVMFDDTLKESLQEFQRKHSLNDDGHYGPQTCHMLNLTLDERIKWIDYTLKKIKQEKDKWKGRYILINVPTYTLFAFKDNKIDLVQKIIVGMPSRKTPLIDSKIENVVLNPFWHVPRSILFKDKIRKIQKQEDYLESHGYELFDNDGIPFDQNEIDWELLDEKYFPYTLRQKPGPQNALGQIKFHLLNDKSIYMHGTPDIKLFQKGYRALSSGCIRVEDPLLLAEWVLDNPKFTSDEITKKIDSEKTIHLPPSGDVWVHITYFPVFINEEGDVVFSNNVYGYDLG